MGFSVRVMIRSECGRVPLPETGTEGDAVGKEGGTTRRKEEWEPATERELSGRWEDVTRRIR